ncbi:MAG TPA: sulfatase [Thermoanaerobaculia bacterium]|nr:sulfatase [Thermoanaerobaculia bacterium]
MRKTGKWGGGLAGGAAAALAALLGAALAFAAAQEPGGRAAGERLPNVVIATIDALRCDRLSAYGYRRATSPNIDRLLAAGARFTQARTVEPLTNPALCSMFTSMYPHEHGATRNGLRLRPGLPSLARILARQGYQTAAFVGNWTLADRISGLGEHFQRYGEVLTRRRWFGLFRREATAEDLTDAALAWLGAADPGRPFLLWVHYVEPHAPYRLQEPFAARLGIATGGEVAKADRYDTEVAFADHHLGRLLAALDALGADRAHRSGTLVVFSADHGESLGEHNYWGHGRNLYEPTLRIPLGFTWTGKIRPGTVDGSALLLDVAPTVLGLCGLGGSPTFRGFDWTAVLAGAVPPPRNRVAWFEAHRGAVLSMREAGGARRGGLLEVGMLSGSRKEVFRPGERRHWLFELDSDPLETARPTAGAPPSGRLRDWLATVQRGLAASDRFAAADLDAESLAQLRSLGYME